MKKPLTVLVLLAVALLMFGMSAQAQIRTFKGDFFNITRTIEQTSDSVEFIADTLSLEDVAGTTQDFISGDSICIMFVQNRFKIVNNRLSGGAFDYIEARTTRATGMLLRRQTYNGVPVGAGLGTDPAQTGNVIGLRPVYRPVGNIASTSPFNSGPGAIRQVLTFQTLNPSGGSDAIGIRRILFKPNINNLTNLAVPPDTTKDTLRAYHLDAPGAFGVVGGVIGSADLAIVRLLPGTTRMLVWVKDSAQAVDAGEYFGSFGDYSRGRYFLGDDGLPAASTFTPNFRPGPMNAAWGPGSGNPDEGMIIDGFPDEANNIRSTNLYYALAPGYGQNHPNGATYVSYPNPYYGLIPPYRVGGYATAALAYQPGLVTSAIDTLRFLDAWGNRTWDTMTQPVLKAIAWNSWGTGNGTAVDRTIYLRGYQDRDDTLRQIGQIVYRRLSYTHADLNPNIGSPADSVQVIAMATVSYMKQGGIIATLQAVPDTSGGFPRVASRVGMNWTIRSYEAWTDNMGRTTLDDDNDYDWNGGTAAGGPPGAPNNGVGHPGPARIVIEPNRTPVDPAGINSLPPTGVKITVRPNIPRRIQILPKNIITNQIITGNPPSFTVGDKIKLQITVVDGYGNTVDDNERFKFEVSPFSQRLAGLFDSLTQPAPSTAGVILDSGRVSVNPAGSVGTAVRGFAAATGSNNAGLYNVRVRASWCLNDRYNDLSDPHKRDPNPGVGFNHTPDIPDGSPNNTFGVWFGPGPVGPGSAGFGNNMGQTTAIDSITVFAAPAGIQKVEMVCGDSTFIVNRTGTWFNSPFKALYVRATDIYGNPVPIGINDVKLEIVGNPTGASGDKDFRAAVSGNIALPGSSPVIPNAPSLPDAELVSVPVGGTLPGIIGDVPAVVPYTAIRWYFLAPKNVAYLNLSGTSEVTVRAYLYGGGVSSDCKVKYAPDVVQTVEIFKSWGKPQGTTTPVPWAPGSVGDKTAAGYSVGTPQNAAEANEFYKGYFFRASDGTSEASTSATFPSPVARGATIGSFGAALTGSEDNDATAPIPLDTITVSEHNKQIRIVARLLDQFRNPIGGRLVKFHVHSQTLPITPPKTVLQDNSQRGGFGEFGSVNVADDTLRRTTIGDTAQAGWVTAYFNSGRVGWQIVRIALTPDTMAYDIAPGLGDDLGEGTAVGPSRRGFAPRVIIPIYQRSDTTVRVELYPYTASAVSPIPLPMDLIQIQRYEHLIIYVSGGSPFFVAWSSIAGRTDGRRVHSGYFSGADIAPYIPDTLNLTATSGVNAITAGRTITILAREYDKFGNLVDAQPNGFDTARVRFRMWGPGFGSVPAPYNVDGGTIAPAKNWTRDAYGPMRKARYRHTQISNLVAGVHINQTAFMVGLEYPTPKTSSTTVYFEATAQAVLGGGGPMKIDRDTVKIVSVVKNPTRFDVLRAGQEWLLSTLEGFPFNTLIPYVPGMEPGVHQTDVLGIDNILLSQVYRRNVSTEPVGQYFVVNDDNVPIDIDGDAMFDATGALNPDFDKPVKLPAFNNLNPGFQPFYNLLNNSQLMTRTIGRIVPKARNDGTIFDVHVAGSGEYFFNGAAYISVGSNINVTIGQTGNWTLEPYGCYRDIRRPVKFRVTPVWENIPPTDGEGPSIDGRVYGRLYADSVYTYTGGSRTSGAIAEFMGTYTDRGDYNAYKPGNEKDRVTRLGVYYYRYYPEYGIDDWLASGLIGANRTGRVRLLGDGGDFNRRRASLSGAFTTTGSPSPIQPGAFLILVDSTADQVIDMRVYDPNLRDGIDNMVDDTASYDQGKYWIIRTQNNAIRQLPDVYITNDPFNPGIQGPNRTISTVTDVRSVIPGELPPQSQEPLRTRSYPGLPQPNYLRHTFVVVPYRIAYLSVFPSSFDVSQGLFDQTRLPLGILPLQADVDTLPRLSLIPPPGSDLTKYELFTRLYGQIQHGATSQIPLQNGAEGPVYGREPYARPDTIFRDEIYTYAITPYDRYGNLNTRDTIFVNVGGRFADWEFLDLASGAGSNLAIRAGGQYLRAIPRNSPTNEQYRRDSLRIFNPRGVTGSNRNDFLGIKPDDQEGLSLSVGRARPPFGSGVDCYVPHGLLPPNIVATRPIDVKKPFAPAPFTLNTGAITNTDLFRVDHTGCNAPDEYALDTLTLQWQISNHTNPDYNNPNDTIRYYVNFIVDSVSTNGRTLIVKVKADNDGLSNMLRIDGLNLYNLVFRPGVQPQPNGPDSLVMRMKWFVTAENKLGLVTSSDTAGSSIRQQGPQTQLTPPLVFSINRRPVCAGGLTPANNTVVTGVDATFSPTVSWSPAGDINIDKGIQIGGFKQFNPATQNWEDIAGRTVDTLTYQVRIKVVRFFPAGKGGVPVDTTITLNAGVNATQFSIPASLIQTIFGGYSNDPTSTSADTVAIDWWVDVKDFNYTNGNEPVVFDSTWSGVGCRPHICSAGPNRLILTKLDQGGIEIDPAATASDINKLTGEEVCFTLTAKDKNGNVIRDWDRNGQDVTLELNNSTANTDTSAQSWNSDPDGYTWAVIKDKDGNILAAVPSVDNKWTLPKDVFVNGVTTICLTDTKAETGVTITATPAAASLKNVSAKMNFKSNTITNYLVDITEAAPTDKVFVMRRYEITVYPRDMYLNVSNEEIRTAFAARFPGEFNNTNLGSADIFSGTHFIKGPTNFFILSTTKREKPNDQLQTITAYSIAAPSTVRGTTDPYEIMTHAPGNFNLIAPADNSEIKLMAALNQEDFSWDKAVDPYTDILISKFDPTKYSDDVRYKLTFVDAQSLTRAVSFASNNSGKGEKLTTNHGQLSNVINTISGLPTTKELEVVWFVEATDGLFTTLSTPPNNDTRPGYRLKLIKDKILTVNPTTIPTEYSLGQNYPNPFNPTTEISFALPKATNVKITIFNMLGEPIKTVVNKHHEAGTYKVTWDGTNNAGDVVSSGTYIYKMNAGTFTATRKMVLLK